ncbi:tyrosine-type recombinase/integrase [Cupriavidus necator]|uniref:tyrosine-type recombinase/integrase n=1 Tax=Cupriavidus necator TaxID=106590 RepID=UPI0039C3D715
MQAVQSYLQVRRACGFELKTQGKLLRSFATYSDAMGKSHVCADTAIEWAGSARLVERRARRLGEVIRFARYARAEDPRHEVPPPVFGSGRQTRRVPYILSPDEVRGLIRAASQSGRETLRRYTYSTLFALLACTGIRVSEAIGLRYEDITSDGLLIRCSKFRKSRIVPLHESAQAGLERYLERRVTYAPFDDHVFISTVGKPLIINDVEIAFRAAATKIGLRCSPGMSRPTPHSLRHTFAVRALEACPDERDHITKHMLALSTYLGHAKVANTYWYLQATPELMSGIAERCERFVMGDQP